MYRIDGDWGGGENRSSHHHPLPSGMPSSSKPYHTTTTLLLLLLLLSKCLIMNCTIDFLSLLIQYSSLPIDWEAIGICLVVDWLNVKCCFHKNWWATVESTALDNTDIVTVNSLISLWLYVYFFFVSLPCFLGAFSYYFIIAPFSHSTTNTTNYLLTFTEFTFTDINLFMYIFINLLLCYKNYSYCWLIWILFIVLARLWSHS